MDNDTIELQSTDTNAANQHSDTPFSCNICKRSYTRVDHLARHYRSHTQERPFVCQTCGKSFARIDLLKRHAANHDEGNDDSGTGTGESASKRRKTLPAVHRPRAVQACRACAESKLRCEGSQPCLRCQRKSLVCEYSQSRTSKALSGNRVSLDSVVPAEIPQQVDPSPAIQAEQLNMNESEAQMPDLNVQISEFQLPTPSTFGQGLNSLQSNVPYDQDIVLNFDDLPLLDFLRETQTPANQLDGLPNQLIDDPFPRDVLDFGVDFTLNTPSIFDQELQSSIDPLLLPSIFNVTDSERHGNRSGVATPGLKGSLNILASAQAFKESLWLWTPEKHDHGAREQYNLSLPLETLSPDSRLLFESPPAHHQITNMTRGKILGMVLRTCEPAIYPHVVSNFPSAELLTNLVQHFISFHSQQDMTWIHPGTIDASKESPEFLASVISSGAAISNVSEIRKLGFAIQEAVRIANPLEFERDNRATRELRPLQSFALHLDVGLWSGDRRKMEISESFAMPLLTMVRRAGHYRPARISELPPQQEDAGEALESKWRNWARQESLKRLALYLFYRDTRSSMSLLSQPLLSYAELSTELPCSKDLWLARTATEWKTIFLAQHHDMNKRPASLRSCMNDSSIIFDSQQPVDVETSFLLVVATVWPMIWQYREMKSVAKFRNSTDSRASALTMDSRHHELQQILSHIQHSAAEFMGGMKPAAWVLHEQCLMHLYVSLEDVQLLAGKEGEEEARRAFPLLTAWVESSEARQALFHAGQVVRAAREYPKFLLRDASAVAVYHASLVFWAYAVLSKNDVSANQSILSGNRPPKFVRLDGEETPEVQRFLMLGRGIPCIQRHIESLEIETVQDVPLSEPTEVMSTMTKFLKKQHEAGERSCPPLLENLSKLMHSLGKAAVGRRPR